MSTGVEEMIGAPLDEVMSDFAHGMGRMMKGGRKKEKMRKQASKERRSVQVW